MKVERELLGTASTALQSQHPPLAPVKAELIGSDSENVARWGERFEEAELVPKNRFVPRRKLLIGRLNTFFKGSICTPSSSSSMFGDRVT